MSKGMKIGALLVLVFCGAFVVLSLIPSGPLKLGVALIVGGIGLAGAAVERERRKGEGQ